MVSAIRCDIYNASLRIASRLGGEVAESDWKTPDDFMPEFGEEPQQKVYVQSADDQFNMLRSITGV